MVNKCHYIWKSQTTHFLFVGIILIRAPKSKATETEENPFLPHPVDLDRKPLADKYYLFAYLKCEFDFFKLHF